MLYLVVLNKGREKGRISDLGGWLEMVAERDEIQVEAVIIIMAIIETNHTFRLSSTSQSTL